jgi:hypothetical protein
MGASLGAPGSMTGPPGNYQIGINPAGQSQVGQSQAGPFPATQQQSARNVPVAVPMIPAKPQPTASIAVPPPAPKYRLGRVVATILSTVGIVLMLSSGLLLVVSLAGIKLPGMIGMVIGFTGGPAGAAAIFSVGLAQVLFAQIARAIFDGANAVRDLAALERARSTGWQPDEDDEA